MGEGALSAALYRILSAIARVCIRYGLPFDRFIEIAKRAFIDVASRDFALAGRKVTASRISVLTGIHRKEIARMRSSYAPTDASSSRHIAHTAAVVAAWRREARFGDRRGKPAALNFDSGEISFSDLVKRYGGGDLPPRAVLDELVRVGAVDFLRDGRARLLVDAYVPEQQSADGLAILGSDVADLVATIDHNLEIAPESGFFQRKVAYDNLPVEAIARVLVAIEKEGQATLERLDKAIAMTDRDANPKVRGTGRKRAMVGVYCYVDDHEAASEEADLGSKQTPERNDS